MTLVVAAKLKDDKVLMMGDSYILESDFVKHKSSEPKVLMIHPAVGIGIAGNIRHEQAIVSQSKKLLKNRKNIEKYIKDGSFANDIYTSLDRIGAIKHSDSDPDTKISGEYLIVHGGEIYVLDDGLGIWQTTDSYRAIGAGKEFALGALALIELKKEILSEKILKEVFKAVEKHCNCVEGPFSHIVI